MAQEPAAIEALSHYLSGQDKDSAIALIVRKADAASAKKSLLQGSRARFATATAQPLIELLMGALKDLLQRSGEMPLNRNGAIGWVFDGALWLVAKRAADQVREHLNLHAPDEGVPGETKNDRLFDTWQEYGCITPNPHTQQAIWYVIVHGKNQGDQDQDRSVPYSNRLTMLRFPLQKLWADPAQYPQTMAGRIEILTERHTQTAASTETAIGQSPTLAQPESQPAHTETAIEGESIQTETTSRPSKPKTEPVLAALRTAKFSAPSKVPRLIPQAETALAAESIAAHPIETQSQVTTTTSAHQDGDFLNADDTAKNEAKRTNHPKTLRPAVLASAQPVDTNLPAPISISRQALATISAKPITETAIDFLQWLGQGLASQQIKFNCPDGRVHFIAMGMGLVTPGIFKDFAQQHPGLFSPELEEEKRFLLVQRALVNAGLHVPGLNQGKNMHEFSVTKRGGLKSTRLSLFVLANPERWVVPVPPINPLIT
jgi:hypothetical protein